MQIDRVIDLGVKLMGINKPFMLTGSPGVGKSDAVKQMTVLAKRDLILMHPVTASPTDFKGQPWAGTDKNGMTFADFLPYGDLRKLIDAKKPTVCFIDDVGNDVPGAVQSSIAQLLLARCIGEHAISEHVTFVLATNRRQDKAGVVGFRSHFLDRVVTVLTVEFDPDSWITWGADPKRNMPIDLLMFCKFKPNLFGEFKPSAELEKCGTPRSWAGVGDLINANIDDKEVIVGAVGKGNAIEYLAFRKVYHELPDVNDILLNPDTAPIPAGTDVRFALMGALTEVASAKTMEQVLKYVDRIPQREFTALAVKTINARANATGQKGAVNCKAFVVWASNPANKKLLGMAVSK
jgi:hypothetical protein